MFIRRFEKYAAIQLTYVTAFGSADILHVKQIQHQECKKNYNKIYKMLHNPSILNIIINCISSETLFNLYVNNKLNNCITKKLAENLFARQIEMFIASNYTNYSHLIKLDNTYNQHYTFVNYAKRYSSLREDLYPLLELDNYFVDTNTIAFLYSIYYRKCKTITMFILYSKIESPVINYCGNDVYRSKKSIYINYKNYHIIIKNDKAYHISNLINLEKIYYIDDNIYLNPKYYDELCSGPMTIFRPIIDLKNYKICRYSMKLRLSYNFIKPKILPKCYVCKKLYTKQFILNGYRQLCVECGIFNNEKKEKMADLSGYRIFISGIRQKIGFAAALKLLRCGATVYGTTRYPAFTLYNYMKEPDYNKFKDNLHIIECNFLNFQKVSDLVTFLSDKKLNAIINNACQTVMPSKEYINSLFTVEKFLQSQLQSNLIMPEQIFVDQLSLNKIITENNIMINKFNDIQDHNTDTSWYQPVSNISMEEIFIVNQVNLLVPTILINQLKPTMDKLQFIINVTATEGEFSKKVNDANHAHTNSCKAGLNMLTKTISNEELNPTLFAFAIDPGFISGVCHKNIEFPLSMHDGGSRIIDPIIQYASGTNISTYNTKLKNYQKSEW